MFLTPSQSIIAKDTHRFRVVNCGRRFGKTTLAIEEMKGKGIYRPSRICYIAPTYQQARDIVWEQLKKELLPAALAVNESRLEIRIRTVKGGESFIALRGWESIETLRGQHYDFVVIDEVASMRNFWTGWHEVIRPTLTDTQGEVMFISTPKGFNHFYDLYNLEAKDSDYKSFHFTSYDNTHIKVEELDKAKSELTEDRFAQEYLADFRKTEGLVYKEFDRSKHLFKEIQTMPNFTMAGLDFGYQNPTALAFITKDIEGGYWVTKEWYERGKTEDEVTEYVAAQSFNKVYPDPENPSAIAALRKKGVNVREVHKTKDSIVNGIQKIRTLFKDGKLRIHESCLNLIYELETYSYPDKRDQHNPDELPIKENDHLLDALRYAIFMDIGNKMEQRAPVNYPHKPVANPLKKMAHVYNPYMR